MANLLCCPASRVSWDPELGSNSIPGAVRACQQLTHRGGGRWGVKGGAVHLLLDVVGGAGCGGGYPEDALDFLIETGAVAEDDYPYTATDGKQSIKQADFITQS